MNKKYTDLIRLAIRLVMVTLVLAGCEILEPLQKDVDEEAALEYYKDVPMRKALNKVQADFGKAKEHALYFYSPNNYRAAQLGLKTARAYFRDKEKKNQVLKSIYKAEMAIKDGFEVKKIVDREMSEVVALRISLNALDAKRSHGREYRGLATNTTALIERVEKKKESIFQNPEEKKRFKEDQKELVAQLKDFQLRVVKDKYLRKGENLMAEAQRYDAMKIAPNTYAAAIKAMEDAVSYIEKNVENFDGIQEQSAKFEFAAQRLMNVAREISVVKNLKDDTYEQYVLRQEARLGKIAKALNAGDIRNKNFTTQASQLALAAKTTVKQKQDYALAIAEANATGEPVKIVSESNVPGKGDPSMQHAQQVAAPDPLVAGVPGGDLETLKVSVRLLTDQVYQMTLEISELKGQRDLLKTKIGNLEKQLKSQSGKKKTNTASEKKSSKNATSPSKSEPKPQKAPTQKSDSINKPSTTEDKSKVNQPQAKTSTTPSTTSTGTEPDNDNNKTASPVQSK